MFESKIVIRYLIVTLLVGCGDTPVPAARGFYETGPELLELPCDQAGAAAGRIYFYAEVEVAEPIASVFTCTEQEIPIVPPVCVRTEDYSIDEEGMVRVLCGEFNNGTADFVRIESGY